jgi:hypothetical protein
MHLLERAPLLAVLAGFSLEPACQLLGIRVQPAAAAAPGVARLLLVGPRVLLDGVAKQAGAPSYLSDGQLLAQRPSPDDTECRHVNHSFAPAANRSRLGSLRGSVLDGNQCSWWVSSTWKSTEGRPPEAGHPHDRGHEQEHRRHGLGASRHWLRRVALHRLSPVRGMSATLGCKRDWRRAGFGLKSCSPRREVRVPRRRRCEPSQQCFIGLDAERVRLGTVWVATATHAATV